MREDSASGTEWREHGGSLDQREHRASARETAADGRDADADADQREIELQGPTGSRGGLGGSRESA